MPVFEQAISKLTDWAAGDGWLLFTTPHTDSIVTLGMCLCRSQHKKSQHQCTFFPLWPQSWPEHPEHWQFQWLSRLNDVYTVHVPAHLPSPIFMANNWWPIPDCISVNKSLTWKLLIYGTTQISTQISGNRVRQTRIKMLNTYTMWGLLQIQMEIPICRVAVTHLKHRENL